MIVVVTTKQIMHLDLVIAFVVCCFGRCCFGFCLDLSDVNCLRFLFYQGLQSDLLTGIVICVVRFGGRCDFSSGLTVVGAACPCDSLAMSLRMSRIAKSGTMSRMAHLVLAC